MAVSSCRLSHCLILMLFVASAVGYGTYRNKIPNGHNVAHPCKSDTLWNGVGHQSSSGGGTRNPFGLDFAAAGHTWTTDLCNADSDGDGISNGQELGDPNCLWTEGNAPAATVNITHPGVCEPITSEVCQNNNAWEIDCTDFTCEGMDDEDTVEYSIQFDNTAVPAVETTYICQMFEIPSDREYHMFATTPIIDNVDVMHHTLLYRCDDDADGFETPTSCGMSNDKCSQLIGGWTLGSPGECQAANQGFLAGKGHFTKVLMEHHWNNPTRETGQYDESGMVLYLTPNLREHNLGYLITGEEFLEIPAMSYRHTATGYCPGSCTERKIQESIYITSAHVHMHYLGSRGTIELYRDGVIVETLIDESNYSYDKPVSTFFWPAVEMKPGDELVTTCVFNASSRTEITYYGDATSDEMCYGFMNYYPAEAAFDSCVSYQQTDECTFYDLWNGADRSSTISHGLMLLAAIITAICHQ